MIRALVSVPLEIYSDARIAEFSKEEEALALAATFWQPATAHTFGHLHEQTTEGVIVVSLLNLAKRIISDHD